MEEKKGVKEERRRVGTKGGKGGNEKRRGSSQLKFLATPLPPVTVRVWADGQSMNNAGSQWR